MLNCSCADMAGLPESRTFTVNGNITGVGVPEVIARNALATAEEAVGVPEMAPVLLLRVNPGGNEPEVMLHMNGATPPDSVSVKEYACPATAAGTCAGFAIDGGGTAVAASEADLVLSATDVAVTLNCIFAPTAAGAVYTAEAPLAVLPGAIEPQPGEHPVPFCVSVQFTPLLLASLLTVAVKFFIWP